MKKIVYATLAIVLMFLVSGAALAQEVPANFYVACYNAADNGKIDLQIRYSATEKAEFTTFVFTDDEYSISFPLTFGVDVGDNLLGDLIVSPESVQTNLIAFQDTATGLQNIPSLDTADLKTCDQVAESQQPPTPIDNCPAWSLVGGTDEYICLWSLPMATGE